MPIEHGLPATLNEIPTARLSKEQSSRLHKMSHACQIRYTLCQRARGGEVSFASQDHEREISITSLYAPMRSIHERRGLDMTNEDVMSKAGGSAPRKHPFLSWQLARRERDAVSGNGIIYMLNMNENCKSKIRKPCRVVRLDQQCASPPRRCARSTISPSLDCYPTASRQPRQYVSPYPQAGGSKSHAQAFGRRPLETRGRNPHRAWHECRLPNTSYRLDDQLLRCPLQVQTDSQGTC